MKHIFYSAFSRAKGEVKKRQDNNLWPKPGEGDGDSHRQWHYDIGGPRNSYNITSGWFLKVGHIA